jgi:hypothetical protein
MKFASLSLALLVLAAPPAFAVQASRVEPAPDAPVRDVQASERVTCAMVRTMYADAPQRVCLTEGQRAGMAANAQAQAARVQVKPEPTAAGCAPGKPCIGGR